MGKLRNFLKDLSDYELFVFYKYRFDNFLTKSKNIILEEFQNRKLNPDDYNLIVKKKQIHTKHNNSDLICPRCGSDKYYIEIKKIFKTLKGVTWEKEKEVYVCQVCEYWNSGRNLKYKSLLKRIKRLLGAGLLINL